MYPGTTRLKKLVGLAALYLQTATMAATFILVSLCLCTFFIPECNGQLHNHSLRRRTDQSQDGEGGRRRIVLIAGPHKTGSTSIQNSMYRWMTNGTDDINSEGDEGENSNGDAILTSWSWPGPNTIFDLCSKETMKEYMHGKVFYPFGEALHGCKFGRRAIAEFYACEELLDLYKEEFKKKWEDGYNLAIGTEAFDLVGSFNNGIKIEDIIQQMPTTNLDDFTVVVKYRSPRVAHLISWYHECCMRDMSFPEFLVNEMTSFLHRGSRIIDSLHLAQVFLDFGLKVALIDLSGVHKEGYDVSNVIACDVLNVSCTDDKAIIGDTVLAEIKNVKSGGEYGSITDEDLGELEKIIRRRDCRFQNLMDHPKLNLLYKKDLSDIMESCDGDGISREEMSHEIRKIGERVLSKEEDQ